VLATDKDVAHRMSFTFSPNNGSTPMLAVFVLSKIVGADLNQARLQADARDSRACIHLDHNLIFLLNFEFSRFFCFTPTSELISFHFL